MKSPERWSDLDHHFMEQALRLARRGLTVVEPNPAVGAVIVTSDNVIGRGYHNHFGADHAEVAAIEDARTNGRDVRGACMYVTLEPCCHQGKTPPCTDAIIAAGICQLVVAVADPSTKVSGKGIRKLRRAGIAVRVGLLADEARELNAWFFKYHQTSRPWIIGKWAQTLDGKFACSTGDSQWISSPPSRKHVHKLRRSVQAIVTGIGTVETDDPELTVRLVKSSSAGAPMRIVLDPALRIPIDCKLVSTADAVPTLIFTAANANANRKADLLDRKCQIRQVPSVRGKLDLHAVVDELATMGVHRLLVEAGPGLTSALLLADLFDELVVFQSPALIVDHRAMQLAGRNIKRIDQLLRHFTYRAARRIGDDVMLVLWRK